jgi:hypothetical protein
MLLSLPVTVDRSIAFFTNKKKLADAEDAKKGPCNQNPQIAEGQTIQW